MTFVSVLTSSLSDASGADVKTVSASQRPQLASLSDQLTSMQEDDTATAILKKKKKPNQLM